MRRAALYTSTGDNGDAESSRITSTGKRGGGLRRARPEYRSTTTTETDCAISLRYATLDLRHHTAAHTDEPRNTVDNRVTEDGVKLKKKKKY